MNLAYQQGGGDRRCNHNHHDENTLVDTHIQEIAIALYGKNCRVLEYFSSNNTSNSLLKLDLDDLSPKDSQSPTIQQSLILYRHYSTKN